MRDSRVDHQEVLQHGDHLQFEHQQVIHYRDRSQSVHLEYAPKVQLKNYEMYESPPDKRELRLSS